MKQYVIDNLPNILQHTDTLKCLSFDKYNKQYMTNSQKTAIDFDKVKEDYSIQNRLGNNKPKSNDALYIAKNNIYYFIEFKNRHYRDINIFDIVLKIYDSLFILSDIKQSNGNLYIPNIVDFSKNHIEYILVHNTKGQNYNLRYFTKGKFRLTKFKNFLLKDINIYNKNEFEAKFINSIIANEP